ncbi:MAG TPA: type II secretion system protein [Thermoanaerobaculia bacterium]|nr:type II secretion system protein [Thermoanaerobaculia bacterium]
MDGRRARWHRAAGMSLVEVLVSLLIISTIAVGILPLFSRSMRQNREGGNYTELTNVARSALEEYLQLDFNAPPLTLVAGSTQLVTTQYLDPATQRWVTFVLPAVPPAAARYQRTIQVQQFGSADLLNDGNLDTPLDGAKSSDEVQLKLVRVTVTPLWGRTGTGADSGLFGKRTPVTLEVLKAV